ncbi:MAG: hypothetical protein JRJ39_00425 [Deltaproteobacteria bacterium]|nr:hypothetical protein [Deltaproteobacteria bacterium]MBW1845573.1 hypothetical protein [Deltaproteobacteria bacterium]MBW2032002.1 hypothetical protein [Deltaproteobacteria bacterium]MBW2180962.1 hypothetical protein [Deltaproteobacteria bacterium]
MDENYDLDPNEIIQQLQDLIQKIEDKNDEYKSLGRTRADKTRIFNIEFAKQQLLFKNKGMAISILKSQTLGHVKISMLKFDVDVSEAEYLACREALHAMREIIGTYRSFLTWLRMEYQGQNVPQSVPRFHP